MQILNSKAFYLKNYTLRNRIKTQHNRRVQYQSLEQQSSKNNDALIIKNINKQKKNSLNTGSSASTFAHRSTGSKDTQSIYEKQKSILQKVIDKKSNESRKRRSITIDTSKDSILLERHPLGDVNSLEIEIMKPTDRYFYKMENVRMAQRLLLAKPSSECSTKNLKKFYQQQNMYKANITRLSFRVKKETERSRSKLLKRKKWLN